MPVNCNCTDVTGYRTLAELRSDIMIALGYAVQASNPPPGMTALINHHLKSAQRRLIHRHKALRTDRWFTWSLVANERFYDFPENDENATLATPVAAAFSASTTGGNLVADAYYYRVSAINANGETLAFAQVSQVVGGTFFGRVTVNWTAVTGATGYKVYGRTNNTELLIATVGLVTTYIDDGSITPAGALPTSNTTAECTKEIDPYEITWVGVEQDSGWYELRKGISPNNLGWDQTGWPTNYELKQCIELWPAPEDSTGTLRVRARFKAEPFDADTDKPSIDDELVFLLALGNLKAHYGKPDAGNYIDQMNVLLGNLTAGSHGTRRYIPGTRQTSTTYVEPRPLVPFP